MIRNYRLAGDPTVAMVAVAKVVALPIPEEDTEHVIISSHGHIALKKLIANDTVLLAKDTNSCSYNR